MAATYLEGEVYAVSGNAKVGSVVSIRIGLTPKVVRFPTDEPWTVGSRVVVTVHDDSDFADDTVVLEPLVTVPVMDLFDVPLTVEEGDDD